MSGALYQEALKRLARSPRGPQDQRPLPHRARLSNPLCGDRVEVAVRLDEAGRIADIAIETRACLLCEASAGGLAALARGWSGGDLEAAVGALRRALTAENFALPPGLASFQPFGAAAPHRSRHACVLLPLQAALQAVGQAASSAEDTAPQPR